MVQPDRPQMTI